MGIPGENILWDAAYLERVAKTGSLFLAMMAMGIVESSRGPTLLDLAELYKTQLSVITVFLAFSVSGSAFGSLLFGYTADKFPKMMPWFIFASITTFGASAALVTASVDINMFYAVWFLNGIGQGGIGTGCNAYCLGIWREHGGAGPWMHSIHLAMSLGLGVGPLISAPFLNDNKSGNRGQVGLDGKTARTFFGPDADTNPELPITINNTYGMTTLYPLLGGIAFATALSFVVIGLRDIKWRNNEKAGAKYGQNQLKSRIDWRGVAFVILMCKFFFMYMGMEYSLGTFLAIFSIDSNLHASKAQGTYVTSIFYCSLAAGRLAALFVARYMMPQVMLLISMVFCAVGGAALLFVGQYSLIALEITSAVIGLGLATMYPTGLLWSDNHILVNNKVSALFLISGKVLANALQIPIGIFIEDFPMLLIYVHLSLALGCFVIFVIAYNVGKGIRNDVIALLSYRTSKQVDTSNSTLEVSEVCSPCSFPAPVPHGVE